MRFGVLRMDEIKPKRWPVLPDQTPEATRHGPIHRERPGAWWTASTTSW